MHFLGAPDFDAAVVWMEVRAERAFYGFAEQALLAYGARAGSAQHRSQAEH